MKGSCCCQLPTHCLPMSARLGRQSSFKQSPTCPLMDAYQLESGRPPSEGCINLFT